MIAFLGELDSRVLQESEEDIPIAAVKSAVDAHTDYRSQRDQMTKEERNTFLVNEGKKYKSMLTTIIGGLKGGKYSNKMNYGSQYDPANKSLTFLHYAGDNAKKHQTEEDKEIHNLAVGSCPRFILQALPRIL